MKKTFALFSIVIPLIFTTGCLQDNGDDFNETVEVYTNPTDPTIMVVTEPDGTVLTYSGIKDAEGYPVSTTSLTALYPGDTEPYILTYKDDLPENIFAPNGVSFNFDWTGETTFRINTVSANGEVQISIPIDADSLDNSNFIFGSQKHKLSNSREGLATGFSVSPIQSINHKNSGSEITSTGHAISILKCGEPVKNATVRVTSEPPIGQNNYTGQIESNNWYYFNVPEVAEEPIQYEEKCNKLGEYADYACSFAGRIYLATLSPEKLYNQYKAKIHEFFPGVKDPQTILDVGKKAFDLIPKLCKLHNKNNLTNICKMAFLLYVEPPPTKHLLTFTVSTPGNPPMKLDPVEFYPNQPSSWTIELPGELAIEAFQAFPSNPAPNQSYVASAIIKCPDPNGSAVTISVAGNDGYSNSFTKTITQNSEISLTVPGAEEGVKDVITIQTESKQWQLVIIF
ncbi:MAG: hypothetical protein QNK30_02145 [Bacteroidales bacterium]|nr:hypothetical protein [Bacteroidales bacterium]